MSRVKNTVDLVIHDEWVNSKDDEDLLQKILDALRADYPLTRSFVAKVRELMNINLSSVLYVE